MYSPGIQYNNVSRVQRVTEGVYIANWSAAANKDELARCGITHIVSATPLESTWSHDFEYMLLGESACQPTGPTVDCQCIEKAYIFGENALRFGGRLCYVCDTTISLSSVFLISFLMRYKNLSLLNSMELLLSKKKQGRKRAAVAAWPNGAIMNSLIDYEARLHSEGVLDSQIPQFYAWGQLA
jgi:hypothetical protein